MNSTLWLVACSYLRSTYLAAILGGLEDEVQLAVRMFTPKSVQQALCLAKLQEAAHKAKKTKMHSKVPLFPTPPNKPLATILPKPYPVRAINLPNGNRRTLTPEEFNDKRARNVCFWCDERYTPGHKCKGKRPQLYHIEMEADEDVQEEEQTDIVEPVKKSTQNVPRFRCKRWKG